MDQLLAAYDDEESGNSPSNNSPKNTIPTNLPEPTFKRLSAKNVAPNVTIENQVDSGRQRYFLQPKQSDLQYNISYDDMFAPMVGPIPKDADNGSLIKMQEKNTYIGYIEPAYMNVNLFEGEHLTQQMHQLDDNGKLVESFSDQQKRSRRAKPKREAAGEVEADEYLGPWAPFEGQFDNLPEPDPTKMPIKKKRRGQQEEEEDEDKTESKGQETSVLHVKDMSIYRHNSFINPPASLKENPDMQCYLPKRIIHTYTGHTKGVSKIQFFPKTGHLILSASFDGKVKLWDVYNNRSVIRTYSGHELALKDVDFSCDGRRFISCSYDKTVRLWDTEKGVCISKFTNGTTPYCLKFNPKPDMNVEFLVGCENRRIYQWDSRQSKVIQEYDRHKSAVNALCFIDENRKFVSSSDDKTLRVWEYGINVEMKILQEPWMHSMPALTLHPNKKFFGATSLDNKIAIYTAGEKVRLQPKKVFQGHFVSGYACQPCFSPDGAYVVSGDSGGFVHFWEWRTKRKIKKEKAHDAVCITTAWHPLETSKLITAGWDGVIKLWD
eukprot:GCRY01001341.1.p1 GENE.GCRY01001341.1~~GCRY01001341.1.p1  ORF type:complete len:550 (+),score=139.71 GCRY01001341.1:238-1887(+)